MPWKDPKSREAVQYQKDWWEQNKHKKNKDQIRLNNQKYSKTEKGIKATRIKGWRHKDIVCDDWNDFYDNRWMKTTRCESCNLEFGDERNNRKNLDHQHSSKHIRHIVCHPCNSIRQKIDNKQFRVLLELHRVFNR